MGGAQYLHLLTKALIVCCAPKVVYDHASSSIIGNSRDVIE